MQDIESVIAHYERGNLLERLCAALANDGVDPRNPTMEALAHYDQFHGRGLEATEELAEVLDVGSNDHLLDVGSGIGGPARYLSQRFGCRVTGIDLTAEFCEVARELTRLLGLTQRVSFEHGNALDMPFESASFDGAYSMNVSMNIADKSKLYGEIHRVLRPGGWLALSELALGAAGGPEYPTPWALTEASSFLATSSDTLQWLQASGFTVVQSRDTVKETLEFGARSRALVARGEKPPHRAVMLVHGELAADAMSNVTRGVKQGVLVPFEVICRKRDSGSR